MGAQAGKSFGEGDIAGGLSTVGEFGGYNELLKRGISPAEAGLSAIRGQSGDLIRQERRIGQDIGAQRQRDMLLHQQRVQRETMARNQEQFAQTMQQNGFQLGYDEKGMATMQKLMNAQGELAMDDTFNEQEKQAAMLSLSKEIESVPRRWVKKKNPSFEDRMQQSTGYHPDYPDYLIGLDKDGLPNRVLIKPEDDPSANLQRKREEKIRKKTEKYMQDGDELGTPLDPRQARLKALSEEAALEGVSGLGLDELRPKPTPPPPPAQPSPLRFPQAQSPEMSWMFGRDSIPSDAPPPGQPAPQPQPQQQAPPRPTEQTLSSDPKLMARLSDPKTQKDVKLAVSIQIVDALIAGKQPEEGDAEAIEAVKDYLVSKKPWSDQEIEYVEKILIPLSQKLGL